MRAAREALKCAYFSRGYVSTLPGISWLQAQEHAANASLRSFHTRTANFALADVVTNELNFEKGSLAEAESDSALKNAPDGWLLEVKPSSSRMTLSKMLGTEKLAITVDPLSQDDIAPPPDDGKEATHSVAFTVDSIKGGIALRFDCVYLEDDKVDPQIEEVALVEATDDKSRMFESSYEGPRFEELDENFQEEFAKYLKERGIDANLGQYLCRLVYDKEQSDYVAWLDKLDKFVKS